MRRRAPGQSLVLTALMLPFLAALVLTAMEIGARTWQRAQIEDALRQANRAAVQTWLYPAFASGSLSVRPVDVMQSGAAYFETNLGGMTTLALPPAKTAAVAQWTPIVTSGGACTDPQGRVVTLPRPGMCATVTVTLRSLVGWQPWTATVFTADTVDVFDATP
jgi:Flp pilus assembly protein TadG